MNFKSADPLRATVPAILGMLTIALTLSAIAQIAPATVPANVPTAVPTLLGVDAMNPLQRRCWASNTAERTRFKALESLAVNFGNVVTGMTVPSPFWVDFGIRGMGVIPAGNAHAKAGHHHLLIDTRLPNSITGKIPFDDQHRHFGKGQTGVLLDLAAGKHTLRLLFADHEHRPFFVFSPEVEITVEGKRSDAPVAIDAKNFEASCARWYAREATQPRGTIPQVFIRNLRDSETVGSAFLVGLGVVGSGIAPAASKVKDTGYFVLDVAGGKRNQRIGLSDGRTEALLELPAGAYSLTPRLLGHDGKVLLNGVALPLQVNGS